MSSTSESEDYNAAAEVCLFALRAGVRQHSVLSNSEYVILPGLAPLTREQSCRRLAELPKPVVCSLQADPKMPIISCREMDTEVLDRHRVDAPTTRQVFTQKIAAWSEGEPNPLVELRGGGETLMVPLSVFNRWLLDYDAGGTISLWPPDRDALERGGRAVIRFSEQTRQATHPIQGGA